MMPRSLSMILVAFIVLSSFSAETSAIGTPSIGTDLPLAKGHLISIEEYVVASASYRVTSVQFPGEGDSFVTPEALAQAVTTLKITRLKRSPREIVGNQYKLDKALPTLTPSEKKKRESLPH